MTATEKKWAGRIGLLTLLVGLAAAAKSGGEAWLVPQRQIMQRDSALAVFLVRDSIWKRDADDKLESIDGKLDDVYQCLRREDRCR